MNRLEMTRRFQGHTHTVSGVIYAPTDNRLFSCGRDKNVSWFSVETGLKLGMF